MSYLKKIFDPKINAIQFIYFKEIETQLNIC